MKIAVCDDCMKDALYLKGFLGGHEVRVYSDACNLFADMEDKKERYDLYLLDIYMEGPIDGIELAKKIRIWQEEAAICFVSTSNDFYREAYDLYAIQYLLKPVKEEAVKQLLDKVSKNIISSREHILSICCMDGTVQECKGKLDEMAMQICGDIFMRCHQSFLVNMYHVDSLIGTDLIVAGQRIPISRRYYAEVKRRYQEILFEEVD